MCKREGVCVCVCVWGGGGGNTACLLAGGGGGGGGGLYLTSLCSTSKVRWEEAWAL